MLPNGEILNLKGHHKFLIQFWPDLAIDEYFQCSLDFQNLLVTRSAVVLAKTCADCGFIGP